MAYADGNIIIGTSVDVGGLNTGLNRIGNSFRKLNRLTAGMLGVTALVRLGKAAVDAASDLQEIQNVVDVSFGEFAWKMEAFTNSCIEAYGMSELTAKQVASSFAAMGNSMGLTRDEATSMAIKLTGLVGDFASFYNLSQDYAKVALSAVYTGETETLKRYGIVLTEANLQEYAHTLGIEKSVKKMSAREKLILRYKYILSVTKDIEGDFVRTENSWANQTKVLKELWTQFLIVLGTGLKTVLTPLLELLNKILRSLITWAKTLGAILSKLFGIKWDTSSIQDGADGYGDIADNIDDATDAQKKLTKATKQYLSPLDEISQFKEDKDDDDEDLSDALGLDFDIPWDELAKKAEEAIKVPDINSMFELGQWVRDSIIDWLEKIPWDEIKKRVSEAAKNLAWFLNGLLSFNEDGLTVLGAIGKAIAEFLNTIVIALHDFAQEFDFEQAGKAIADGINRFFATFDFKNLAETINLWVKGIFKLITSAIANINWFGKDGVFAGLWTLIKNIDLSTWLILIGFKLLKGFRKGFELLLASMSKAAIAMLKEWVIKKLGVEGAKTIGEAVLKSMLSGIGTMLTSLRSLIIKQLAKAIVLFKYTIPALMSDVFTILTTSLTVNLTELAATFGAGAVFISGLIATTVGALAGGIIGRLLDIGLGELFEGIDDDLANRYKQFHWFGEGGFFDADNFLGMGKIEVEDYAGALELMSRDLGDLFDTLGLEQTSSWFYKFADKWEILKESGKEGAGPVIVAIARSLEELAVTLATTVGEIASDPIGFVMNIWDIILEKLGFTDENNQTAIDKVKQWFDDFVQKLWETVAGSFAYDGNEIVDNPIRKIRKWLSDEVENGSEEDQNTGKSILDGMLKGMEISASATGHPVFAKLLNYIRGGTEKEFGIHSPAKEMYPVGENILAGILEGFKSQFSAIPSVIMSFFNSFVSLVSSRLLSFKSTVLSIISSIVSSIRSMLSTVTSGISSARSKISSFNSSGIMSFASSKLHIPKLATGAVIPPNSEFMAVLGDQKSGTNIETPESLLRQIMREELSNIPTSGGGNNSYQFTAQLNRKTVFDELIEEAKLRQSANGNNPFLTIA